MKIIDFGCGPNKFAGAFGVDGHPFLGVDQVCAFDVKPWQTPDNAFDVLRAEQVIEHVPSTTTFFKKIHRIAKPGIKVLIETPHFSWVESWGDQTHLWHFSIDWCTFLTKWKYLAQIIGEFELVPSDFGFNKNIRSLFPSMIAKFFGRKTYVKYYAFMFPAKTIITKIKVIK